MKYLIWMQLVLISGLSHAQTGQHAADQPAAGKHGDRRGAGKHAAELQAPGEVVYERFVAPSIKGNPGGEEAVRRLSIYLPPGYAGSGQRYPVVYILHGYNGNDSSTMASVGFKELLNASIAAHHTRPVILVLPDCRTRFGGSWTTNSVLTGNWSDFVAEDVVHFIDTHYRTLSDRNSRGIAGMSMGGNGALKLAMLYPTVFGAVYAMTPAVLNWSDGNNIGMEAFQRIDTMRSDSAVPEDFRVRLMIDLARTYSPNLSKPPFYADFPAHYIGDSLVVDNAIVKKWEANFPTVLIETHIAALKSLRAIKLDWGRNDAGTHVPVTCLEFSKKLERYGIEHFAEGYLGEHAGNLDGIHGRVYTEVLPFFDEYLEFGIGAGVKR